MTGLAGQIQDWNGGLWTAWGRGGTTASPIPLSVPLLELPDNKEETLNNTCPVGVAFVIISCVSLHPMLACACMAKNSVFGLVLIKKNNFHGWDQHSFVCGRTRSKYIFLHLCFFYFIALLVNLCLLPVVSANPGKTIMSIIPTITP